MGLMLLGMFQIFTLVVWVMSLVMRGSPSYKGMALAWHRTEISVFNAASGRLAAQTVRRRTGIDVTCCGTSKQCLHSSTVMGI